MRRARTPWRFARDYAKRPSKGSLSKQEVTMLGDKDVIATVSVKDLAMARKFYEGTLGLHVADAEGAEALTFDSGHSKLIVYRSEYAGTNKATALNWKVGDGLELLVAELRQKGVTFEHYDFPGSIRKGDVHVMGTHRAAWFKDPDGNIISLMA
jgi:catechol 2,3-dioxygenase-like lactoylglutathione lyase family enzyme